MGKTLDAIEQRAYAAGKADASELATVLRWILAARGRHESRAHPVQTTARSRVGADDRSPFGMSKRPVPDLGCRPLCHWYHVRGTGRLGGHQPVGV